MPSLVPLSQTYAQARQLFLHTALAAGAQVTSHPHPLAGLEGEELAVDVAELGPRSAEHVVLVVSATHGVEGYCGSALQQNWLERHATERPADVRLVMVHALNPYGFSWVRRVNEDNVDLNRNFVDWPSAPPQNPAYDALADVLVPQSWSEDEQLRTTLLLVEAVEKTSLEEVQSVVSRGQYSQPDGVFYGGAAPVWSNRWLRSWCAEHLGEARRVSIVDLHSGLGEWGDSEAICVGAIGTPAYQRAEDLWGKVASMVDGEAVGAILEGDWLSSVDQLAPHAEVTAIALEYGTLDPVSVVQALRADAWLHAHGDPTGADAPAIRALVRAAFADDDPAWLERLWVRFEQVLAQALAR